MQNDSHLFPSEAVDRTAPALHTSPAAKTFSKSAASPRNNAVAAPMLKSSPALNAPRGSPGTGEHIRTCYVIFGVVASFDLQRAASFFQMTARSAVTFIAVLISDTKPF